MVSRVDLVLASRSPQRKAILEQLGVEFEVVPSGVGEIEQGDPDQIVVGNALRKAHAVAERVGSGKLVIGVDTEVYLDGKVLGKAPDRAVARSYLSALSGRSHEVFSGLALIDGQGERTSHARTTVVFRKLEPSLLDWYLATGEWSERAGAYAIQGYGSALVERIDGDFWNVVGLPLPLLLELEPQLLGAGH